MRLPHETKGGTIGAGLGLIIILSMIVRFVVGEGG